ncbi:glutathione S-transferase kappa 1-like [Dendronephthya gigantea]|uniref:glutathione S-transferase kappa 1-like n=1 Tax=Dendronephthya gigantea TaxID=151771 RepID=UPI00106A5320|nr:glutathione S-transferase kappa 1-like [Dendronephthya gigantea]
MEISSVLYPDGFSYSLSLLYTTSTSVQRCKANMTLKKTIELFYDVLSPYSWIGFEVLLRCRAVWNINVDLQPVLLAGIMKESENTPPGMNPRKGAYLFKDVKRIFEFHNLGHIKFPEDPAYVLMVKGSIPTMRLLTAAKISHANKLEDLSREFWNRIYRTGEDHVSHESLVEVCVKCGLSVADSEQLVEESKTTTIKEKLKETTQRVLDYGAFGSPTFLVENKNGKKEMFFGSDRFHLIAHCIGAPWPLNNPNSKL